MKKNELKKLYMIKDVGPMDSRFKEREEMIGCIVRAYPSEIWDTGFGWCCGDTWQDKSLWYRNLGCSTGITLACHAQVKLERL